MTPLASPGVTAPLLTAHMPTGDFTLHPTHHVPSTTYPPGAMPELFSANIQYLKGSDTVAISAACKARRAAGEDVYDLSIG